MSPVEATALVPWRPNRIGTLGFRSPALRPGFVVFYGPSVGYALCRAFNIGILPALSLGSPMATVGTPGARLFPIAYPNNDVPYEK